jgi:hypothetical protein
MCVDIVDHHDDPVDDVRRLEPLSCERAGLSVPARALIRVGRVPDHDDRSVELEHDIGDRAHTVMKAFLLSEAEDLADPLGRETRILIREHRDRALLSHRRPPSLRNK